MSNETPAEREERLQRQEERLQKAHERRSNPPPSVSHSSGGGLGNIGSFFAEHKIGMIVGLAAAIVLYIFWKNNSSSSGANNSPNYAGATGSGILPSDLQTALDQLTQQYNNIQNELATGSGSSSGSGSGSGGGSGGGGSTNVANAPFNSEPSLLPAGWTITKDNNGDWIATNPDQSTGAGKFPFIDLSKLFPGIQITAGGNGRMWYQLPGWSNQQMLTDPGATGTFINQLGNGNFVNPTTSNPPIGQINGGIPPGNGGGANPNLVNYGIGNPNVAKSTYIRSA